ncbi:MAG: efflux RND transporter periplasmic adaptor subunit [Candidatus Thiodiazotropha sp.]
MIICLLFSGQSVALDLQAVTNWHQMVELSTSVNGMVSRVNAAVGERVSRGTILLELDQRAYTSRLAAAESRLEATTQQNAEAKRELDRSLELYDRTLLSDHERKQAEIVAAEADAAYREADAELAKVRLLIDYSRITAPFDGIIEEIHVQPGQAVINRQQAQPLLTLCRTERMKVVTDVTAQQAETLKSGMAVQIGVRGQWLKGEISRSGLVPVAEDANGPRYRLEASFQPPEGTLIRAGEKAVLRIADE